jgi:hypothetical protein
VSLRDNCASSVALVAAIKKVLLNV